MLSFIGRHESLQVDFQSICDQIGINATLPHYNASRVSNLDLHYNDELYELVSCRFAEDIKLLGYSDYLSRRNFLTSRNEGHVCRDQSR